MPSKKEKVNREISKRKYADDGNREMVLFLRNGSEIYFDGANEVLFEGIPNLPFDDLDIKDKDKLIDSFFPEISDQTVEFLLTDNEKED